MVRSAAGFIGPSAAARSRRATRRSICGPTSLNSMRTSDLPPASPMQVDAHWKCSAHSKSRRFWHFQWMRDYGIDGAFVQRFINDLRDPRALRHNNTVLAHCREGANRFGRAYVVMYDLSGL